MLFAQAINEAIPEAVARQEAALYILGTVGVIIVIAFLGFLGRMNATAAKEREADRQERKDTREFIATLGESCHSAQSIEGAQNRTMMSECSMALRQNSTALASNAEVLRDVRDILDEQRKGK